jgi:hypothetical protein
MIRCVSYTTGQKCLKLEININIGSNNMEMAAMRFVWQEQLQYPSQYDL